MSSSTGTVVFNDSRVRAVDVIANEKVGIGTSLPTSNLHLVGNAYVTSNLEVGTANLFVDTTTGRIGVGTDSPSKNLQVYGTSYPGVIVGGPNSSISLITDTVSPYDQVIRGTSNVVIEAPANSKRLFINGNNGYVGIGTTNPIGLLDIRASSTDPGAVPTVHIGDAEADSGDYGMVNLVRNATTGGSKCHLSFIRNGNMVAGVGYYNNTDTLGIWNAFSSVTNAPSLSIQSNHNVGVGTTNPSAKLHVQGDLYVSSPKIENYFYGTSTWSYSLGAGTTLGNLWSFTYNAPADGYIIVNIQAHYNYSQTNAAFYAWISIDDKHPRDSSLYDSSQQGHNDNMGKFHDYKDPDTSWNDFNHQTCAYVSAGNHTISLRISKNTNYYAYVNGSGVNLLFIPKNYM